jgi:uncharacterized protein YaaN involved in tellurite resistance
MNEPINEQALVLQPPEPVQVVAPQKAAGMVPLDDSTRAMLDAKIGEFVANLVKAEAGGEALQSQINSIHNLGKEEIAASAQVSNRMMDRPVKAMNEGLFDEKSSISSGLIALRTTVEELDPGAQGDLFSPRKILGFIPFGNKLKNYFHRYQSAQTHLNKIIESLLSGQDELRKDNAAIEQEKATLWELMQKLEQYVYLGKRLDTEVEAKIADIEPHNPEKARVIQEELLFYLRQKVQDLLTQLAVSVQGYLALDMVRKNNLELIKGVDRATSTTVSALRTAVIVAQALTNQKLVLDQISALNATTGTMIESTSKLLKSNTATIHEQAASSTVELDKLKAAFQNVYDTMDMISTFKVEALNTMKQTVDTLTDEVDKSRKYLDKARQAEAQELDMGGAADQLKV